MRPQAGVRPREALRNPTDGIAMASGSLLRRPGPVTALRVAVGLRLRMGGACGGLESGPAPSPHPFRGNSGPGPENGGTRSDTLPVSSVVASGVRSRLAVNDVVVVVSAMGDSTDDLIALARRVSPDPPPREMDMLLTAGERISMSLLAMAIADLGVTAKSFTGSQAGIITDTLHGKARILDVRAGRISDAGAEGTW